MSNPTALMVSLTTLLTDHGTEAVLEALRAAAYACANLADDTGCPVRASQAWREGTTHLEIALDALKAAEHRGDVFLVQGAQAVVDSEEA
jgi:hypothetical protein